jgi:phosphoglycolate phosphatase
MWRTELIVFDWDGTLIDSAARIVEAVQNAIGAAGLPERDAASIRHVIGLGMPEAVATLYPDAPADAQQRLLCYYREAFADAIVRRSAPLFDGVERTVAQLEASGYMLAIATGKSRSGLQRDLAETGLSRYFVADGTADVYGSKPDPAMLEVLLREFDLPPQAALMVGDTVFDLQMAQSAGVAGVAVPWGAHSSHPLAEAGPDAWIDAIDELPACVQRLEHGGADHARPEESD